MANYDSRMPEYDVNRGLDPLDGQEISLKPLVRIIWSYRRVIAASVSAIVIAFLVAGLYRYVSQPVESQASVEFRLLFEGADSGEYPNGLAFSRSEIISTPILTAVYQANELQRYCTYDQFKNAVFILESSRDLEMLAFEYQAKLADTRLNPIDRSRLEAEFRQKQDALRVPQYTLNFMNPGDGPRIPPTLMSKVLNDILAVWAEEAVNRKGVLSYDVRVYSPNVLLKELLEAEEYVVRLDIFREKINSIIANIDELSTLPGIELIRVGERRISLPEIRANLDDLRRFKVEPLVGTISAVGIVQNPIQVSQYIESRLFQVRLEHQAAANQVATLQDGLRTYMREGAGAPALSGRDNSLSSPFTAPGASTIIPQLGESFLDRLVSISRQDIDAQYRQGLTDQIIEAGKITARLQREASYYEELSAMARRLTANAARSGGATREAAAQIERRFEEIYGDVARALGDIDQIYKEVSVQNLNPRTSLYTITTPFWSTLQRALSLRTVAFYGLLTLISALLLAPLACIVYHYLRTEILSPRRLERDAVNQTGEKEDISRTVGV